MNIRKKSNFDDLNERKKTARQMVYQRGSQRDGSPHYVLLYSDDENSEDEEHIPLQNLSHSTSAPRKVEVIKIQIQPEDTLQAVALKYRCTVSELKRINKIHKDNEIFAHRSIKVPVQPYSILTESLSKIQHKETSSSISETEKASTTKDEQILNLISTPIVVVSRNSEINDIILNSILEPISNEPSENVIDSEDAQLLSLSDREPMAKSYLNDVFSCSGADWGLSWLQLLAVFLVLSIAVPFIYVIYASVNSKHSVSGHNNSVHISQH